MVLFSLTTCMAVLAYFGIQTGAGWFVPGVIAAVLAGISLLLSFIVNLSIRNGHRNVEKILESLK